MMRLPSSQISSPCVSQLRVQLLAVLDLEARLHGARVRPGANQALLGAFAQQQLQSADDDGFARPGLAGDGGKTGRKLPVEVIDQREIFDAQRGERCQHGSAV